VNRRQKIFLALVAVVVAGLLIGIAFTTGFKQSEKMQVVATFYPLYFFASEIAKEKAEVSMLIPENAEPHSWQPGISDMLKMEKASLFIYNGAGLEPWVEDFLNAIQNKPVIVDSSQNISLLLTPEVQEALENALAILRNAHATELTNSSSLFPSNQTYYSLAFNTTVAWLNISEEKHIFLAVAGNCSFYLKNTSLVAPEIWLNESEISGYSPLTSAGFYHLMPANYQIFFNSSENINLVAFEIAEHEHEEHGLHDPHIWLDPLLAKIQVLNILEGFKKADPQNADFYVKNANALVEKLEKLHTDFSQGLKNKTKKDIICSHLAFNYMGKRYGFKVHAALGITADKEPSPQELAELARLVRELGLNYVYVEPGYPDKYMQTIANETQAGILVLDAIHGRTGEHAKLDYFGIMYENLRNLRIGLEVRE